jgi:hypothetical protein
MGGERSENLKEKLLSAATTPSLICTVTVVNEIPDNYGAYIASAGVDFTYHDGTTFQDYENNLHLRYRQAVALRSNDATKCVRRMHEVIVIRFERNPNDPPVVLDTVTPEPAPGKCWIEDTITDRPKSVVSEKDLQSRNLQNLFEIISNHRQ